MKSYFEFIKRALQSNTTEIGTTVQISTSSFWVPQPICALLSVLKLVKAVKLAKLAFTSFKDKFWSPQSEMGTPDTPDNCRWRNPDNLEVWLNNVGDPLLAMSFACKREVYFNRNCGSFQIKTIPDKWTGQRGQEPLVLGARE